MIILDTNVVSEPLKPHPSQAVVSWLDKQNAETLFLTATSLSELRVGIAILPNGKRKKGLTAGLDEIVQVLFESRILSFDVDAAEAYAAVVARAKASGKSISVADAQIAAIATVYKFTVATRDTAPFLAAKVPVINPWKD